MNWHPDMPESYRNQIVTGDARELAKNIPDESIDLILTDPPYPLKFIHLYEDLARMAARILKPSGYLFTLAGHEHLPNVISKMTPHLRWWWINANMQPGNATVKHWQKDIAIWWKPVLVWRRFDHVNTRWFTDAHLATRDKRYHTWGQSGAVFSWYVQWMCELEGVTFDPFVGGGTVPAVCKMLGRNYIAFEINPETAELACQRVANTPMPLFTMEPEQLEMEIADVG